jgi:Rps23 Pro-64 3,4-dihydroxylase Tpa1-like proline 4-hydroxylase
VRDLQLSSLMDREAARADMLRHGRAHIRPLWDHTTAEHVLALLEAEREWNLAAFLDGRHCDFDASALRAMSDEQRRPLTDLATATARKGFGYLYENFPIYDVWHRGARRDHPLFGVFAFLNSSPFLDAMRDMTGCEDIGFADAQATCYRPGHFLTLHNDEAPERRRRAAFVINLTREWRADWGGILLFHSDDGHISAGMTPVFNAINVFLTPQDHSVSVVAPYAKASRYAITGWLRAGADPGP